MFKKKPQKKLIIVPQKPGQHKIDWRHIIKGLKTKVKALCRILGVVVLVGAWVLSIHMIQGTRDLIHIIRAVAMTGIIVIYIWVIFPRKPRFPKDSNKTGE